MPNTPLRPAGDANTLPSAPARYAIPSQVGVRGMCVVFKARDRETGEIIALKVLTPEIADQPFLMENLKNELRRARRITHKNVCRIYDFSRADGFASISMEFVQGESLRNVLNRFGDFTILRAL